MHLSLCTLEAYSSAVKRFAREDVAVLVGYRRAIGIRVGKGSTSAYGQMQKMRTTSRMCVLLAHVRQAVVTAIKKEECNDNHEQL